MNYANQRTIFVEAERKVKLYWVLSLWPQDVSLIFHNQAIFTTFITDNVLLFPSCIRVSFIIHQYNTVFVLKFHDFSEKSISYRPFRLWCSSFLGTPKTITLLSNDPSPLICEILLTPQRLIIFWKLYIQICIQMKALNMNAKHSSVSTIVPQSNWTLAHVPPVTWKLLYFTCIAPLLCFYLVWLNPESNRSSNNTKTEERQ